MEATEEMVAMVGSAAAAGHMDATEEMVALVGSAAAAGAFSGSIDRSHQV